MHSHGIHGHMPNLLAQQLPATNKADSQTTSKLFSSELTINVEPEEEDQSQTVDPEETAETNEIPHPQASQLGYQPTNSEALTPDLTVEPLIYGAKGKMKYVQNGIGRKFSGSA